MIKSFTFINCDHEYVNDLHVVVRSLDIRIKDKGEFKHDDIIDRNLEHQGDPTSRIELYGHKLLKGGKVTLQLENIKGEDIEILEYIWSAEGKVLPPAIMDPPLDYT